MTKIQPKGRGPSILAQMTKIMKNRGVVILTFWWDNTITQTDGFGNHKKWAHDSRESMRAVYRDMLANGWALVERDQVLR